MFLLYLISYFLSKFLPHLFYRYSFELVDLRIMSMMSEQDNDKSNKETRFAWVR